MMAKVLVVDDQPHVTLVLALWLEKQGHDVMRADDGVAALELLRSQALDVLITDVDMPQMDGLSLIGNRAEVDHLKGVIVLTGRNDYRDLGWLHGRQNVQFVPKPFSPTGVAQAVDEIMSSEPSVAAS